jgi:hypothetical protein
MTFAGANRTTSSYWRVRTPTGTFFPGGPATTADGFRTAQQPFGELSDGFLDGAGTDGGGGVTVSCPTRMRPTEHAPVGGVQNKRGRRPTPISRASRRRRQAIAAQSSHTVEISGFNNPTGLNWDETDSKIADTMSSYWVNFATKGDPNGPGLPMWPVYKDHASGRVMVLGDSIGLEPAPPSAKLTFYDAAYARLLRN